MKVKEEGPSFRVQKADEDLSEEMEKALLRAKELFDAGAMSMQDYQNYREQILAPDSDEEDEDDGGDEATASEAESEPDPRLDMKREDPYSRARTTTLISTRCRTTTATRSNIFHSLTRAARGKMGG